MTYQQYLDGLRQQQEEWMSEAEDDRELHQQEQDFQDYWDCLEMDAPPEFLEDCPQ